MSWWIMDQNGLALQNMTMMALIWEIFAIWMIIGVIFLVRIIKLFALAAFVITKVNVAI